MNIMSHSVSRQVLFAPVGTGSIGGNGASGRRHTPDRRTGQPDTRKRKLERRAASSDRRQHEVALTAAAKQKPGRVFLRGTNLQPTGEKLKPCVKGSKQSILVDMLSRPEGATMEELIAALSGGRRPWTEPTVRSGFGWDLKRKGYGVRSEFDATGEERFHLIVPKRQKIPPHIDPAEARQRAKAGTTKK